VEGELAGAEFGVVRVSRLGFMMLPDARPGGGRPDVETGAHGDEIGVDSG